MTKIAFMKLLIFLKKKSKKLLKKLNFFFFEKEKEKLLFYVVHTCRKNRSSGWFEKRLNESWTEIREVEGNSFKTYYSFNSCPPFFRMELNRMRKNSIYELFLPLRHIKEKCFSTYYTCILLSSYYVDLTLLIYD
jgi:hypothetical protein